MHCRCLSRGLSHFVFAILLALYLLRPGDVGAQRFEDWIPLPDSLRAVKSPQALVWDSTTNTVYVGGRNSTRVLGVSGDSNRLWTSIRVHGPDIKHSCVNPVSRKLYLHDAESLMVLHSDTRQRLRALRLYDLSMLYYNPLANKVYCQQPNGTIVVVDGVTDSVRKVIAGSGWYGSMCLDLAGNRLYVTQEGGSVSVIDGTNDSLLASVRVTGRGVVRGLCYCSRENKVYCGTSNADTLTVIDCNTNQVVAAIRMELYPHLVLYSPVQNRVYCVNGVTAQVAVVDCETDELLCAIPLGLAARTAIYNPRSDRAYFGYSRSLVVLDCGTNAMTRLELETGAEELTYNATNNTIIAAGGGKGISIVDGAGDTVIAVVATSGSERPRTACWSSVRNKVYVANCVAPGNVAVIDGESNAVVGWVPTGMFPVAIAYNRALDRVYTADSVSSSVTVIDCATDSAIASIRVGGRPTALLVLPDAGKVYCANKASNTVSVIDAGSNSVAKTITTGGTYPCALAHSPESDKVYCLNQGSSTITVINLLSDSVVGLINTKVNPAALVCSPASNKLFCSHAWGDTALVVDCSNDSVVAKPYIPKQYDLGYHPDNDWVYFSKHRFESGRPGFYYLGMTVVNCATNGVVSSFDLPDRPSSYPAEGRLEFAYNGINRRMYCRGNGGGVYIYAGTGYVRGFGTQGFGGGFAWNERQNRMYAACQTDSRIAVFRDGCGGIEENPSVEPVSSRTLRGTIIRGMLHLRPSPFPLPKGEGRKHGAALLDATGRRVMSLVPGANDVRHLAPGVYFVREPSAVSRVVVTR
ncbi:YncE family protein [candidate division WOR-3 bacterium]|nr:YncE family protein [candidate division WOR-3 bacterium]